MVYIFSMKEKENYLKLIFLGILALLLLNFPILSIVGNKGLDGSVSSVYIYVFFIWLAIILMAMLVLRKRKKGGPHE